MGPFAVIRSVTSDIGGNQSPDFLAYSASASFRLSQNFLSCRYMIAPTTAKMAKIIRAMIVKVMTEFKLFRAMHKEPD